MAYVQQKTIHHAPHHHHNHHHEDAKFLSSSVPTSFGLNGFHQRRNSTSTSPSTIPPLSPNSTSSPSPTLPNQQPTDSNEYYKIAVQNSTNNQQPLPLPLPLTTPSISQQTFPTLSRKFVARRISEGETGRLKEELKCQACGKGYKHVSSLAKHLWEHTPEWNVTSKLLISKHQQVQLLEAASILVSMNEEDEEEDEEVANYEFSINNNNKSTNGYFNTNTLTPPPTSGLSKLGGATSYFTSTTTNNHSTNALTPPPTSGSNSTSGTPTLPEEPTKSTFSDSSPSPPPLVPSIPISSSTRAISKHTTSSLSSSLHFTRRSSVTVSSAYPPSSARRGSIPINSFTPSSPGFPSSLTQRASAASLSKSPIVTDSLFSNDIINPHKIHDEYEMLSTPNRTRRMSHMRRTSRADIYDNPSPPEDDDDKGHHHSHNNNGDESQGVFGDMDD